MLDGQRRSLKRSCVCPAPLQATALQCHPVLRDRCRDHLRAESFGKIWASALETFGFRWGRGEGERGKGAGKLWSSCQSEDSAALPVADMFTPDPSQKPAPTPKASLSPRSASEASEQSTLGSGDDLEWQPELRWLAFARPCCVTQSEGRISLSLSLPCHPRGSCLLRKGTKSRPEYSDGSVLALLVDISRCRSMHDVPLAQNQECRES